MKDFAWFCRCSVSNIPDAAGAVDVIAPSYTPARIRSRLVSTAQDIVNVESGVGWDRYTGYGMVDIQAACRVADGWSDHSHADGTCLGTYLHPCGSMLQAPTNVPAGGEAPL